MLSLLQRQYQLYNDLNVLTNKQGQLVQSNSDKQLLLITARRCRLIAELQKLNSKLRPLKTNWYNLSKQISSAYKNKAYRMVSETQKIIGEILSSNRWQEAKQLGTEKDLKIENFHLQPLSKK